jgi:hypothetical protein
VLGSRRPQLVRRSSSVLVVPSFDPNTPITSTLCFVQLRPEGSPRCGRWLEASYRRAWGMVLGCPTELRSEVPEGVLVARALSLRSLASGSGLSGPVHPSAGQLD